MTDRMITGSFLIGLNEPRVYIWLTPRTIGLTASYLRPIQKNNCFPQELNLYSFKGLLKTNKFVMNDIIG